MAVVAQNYNFIASFSGAINAVLDARAQLKALRERSGATGIVARLQATDFVDQFSSLTVADIAASSAVMDQIEALLTDFTKTPPEPTASLAALLKFRP